MLELLSVQESRLDAHDRVFHDMVPRLDAIEKTQVEIKETQVEIKETQVEIKETQVKIDARLTAIEKTTQESNARIGGLEDLVRKVYLSIEVMQDEVSSLTKVCNSIMSSNVALSVSWIT